MSILNEDLADFERNVVQLKVYYGAVQPESTVASSSLFHPLMGTRLLHLLVENRMADFHNEVHFPTQIRLFRDTSNSTIMSLVGAT